MKLRMWAVIRRGVGWHASEFIRTLMEKRNMWATVKKADGTDPSLIRFIRTLDPPPRRFADVGAFVGVYSLIAASKGAEVWAFEPDPTSYRYLRTRTKGKGSIHLYNYAIGGSEGVLPFNVRWPSGGSFVVSSNKVITVPVKTLDSFHLRPDVIKIDTEGFELEVLRGAEATLAESKPIVLVECHGSKNLQRVINFLANHGYGYQKLPGSRASPSPFDLVGQLAATPLPG